MAAAPAIADQALAGPIPFADWLVIAPVVVPLLFGAVLLMFRRETAGQGLAALAGLAATVAAGIALLWRVVFAGPLAMTMGSWLPPFGIVFTADLLGAVFSLTASFVVFACALFAIRDIDAPGRRYGFYPFLMLLMTGINGAFLTGDIFNLYVWFEVFVISSFGLIILGSQKAQLDGATKYAILNLVATTLFLIATAYLYGAVGTLNMADIARKVEGLRGSAPLATMASLFLLAFAMKAAAFPVNFWLPASYHTPRIVTAALFGGLLTKIGVYALLRVMIMLFPVERALLSGVIEWGAIATMLLGAMGALAQSDIRRMAGFLVISGVGVMCAGLAVGSQIGLAGTIFYAVHSMLAMTALYLLAGVMKEAGGSFSLHDLGGLYRSRPLLAGLAFLIVLSVAGLPPGSGLWPKIMLVKAALEAGAWPLAGAILVSAFFVTIALARLFILAFWRDLPEGATGQTDGIGTGYVVLMILAVPMLVMGVFPEPVVRVSLSAASGLLDATAYVDAVFPQGER